MVYDKFRTLSPSGCTWWVVVQVLSEFGKGHSIATSLGRRTFSERMTGVDLGGLVAQQPPPRQSIALVASTPHSAEPIVEGAGQRSMISSIARFLPSYAAGIRCWAAFMDVLGRQAHCPASGADVIKYMIMLGHSTSFET